MTILGLQMDGSNNDTRQVKATRALLGAFYGFLAGAAFVWVAALIDIWLHPDLPLGLNWDLLWMRLPLFALGLAIVGAVTCWWNEAWPGLLGGAATAAALALLVALLSTNEVTTGMKFIVLIFILVPIAAMTLPIIWIMRWLVEKHIRALHLRGSYGRVVGLILLALLLGSAAGYFMRMSAGQLEVTRQMHSWLQDINTEDNPLANEEGVKERAAGSYQLYSTKSESSTSGFDVSAKFDDGYVLTCTVVRYPGRPPYLSSCVSEK